MGELSKALEEFSRVSKRSYEKIQKILKEEYCWKCPMRSTSKSTSCRDIDAWIRLTGAFERGIHEHLLSKDGSKGNLEAVTSRYLSKVIKKHSRHLKYQKTTILKVKEDIEPFAQKNDLLILKENVESIKSGDLVLWPAICPVSIFWFSKAKLAGYIPFNILKVSKAFHREGCMYVQSENNMEIPLEYVVGKIIKVVKKDDPLYFEYPGG